MPVSAFTRALAGKLALFKRPIEAVFALEASIAAAWASNAHWRLHLANRGLPPAPEYYNHKLDLYWMWPATRNSLWLERGVYSMLAIKPDSKMLEVCCGDGFNSYYFYSKKAASLTAVDFDPQAIKYARKHYNLPNVNFQVADIRSNVPEGDYDNVVWDGAIEHFTESEIESVMPVLKTRLAKRQGILSGYTIVERPDGRKSLEQHEYEFKSKEDLLRFIAPHFKHAIVFETLFPERHNLYFWASDGEIPFAADWAGAARSQN
jgi:SAM-dependent methyltransferase